MNEIFSINRFGKLLKNDLVRYLPQGYGTFITFLCIMPAIWALFTFIFDSQIILDARVIGFILCTMICSFVAVFKLYNSANHKKKGVDFVMLPASAFEKFLSMILIGTLLVPALFAACAYLIDCLLATLPVDTYQGYIGIKNLFSIQFFENTGIFILFLSFALCGNMLFKKAKVAKTILSVLGLFTLIGYLTSLSAYVLVKNMAYTKEDGQVYSIVGKKPLSEDQITDNTIIIDEEKTVGGKTVNITRDGKTYSIKSNNVNSDLLQLLSTHERMLILFYKIFIFGVIPGLMYFLTYHRIKKQQM